MFLLALTFAGSRGSCLNMRPLDICISGGDVYIHHEIQISLFINRDISILNRDICIKYG